MQSMELGSIVENRTAVEEGIDEANAAASRSKNESVLGISVASENQGQASTSKGIMCVKNVFRTEYPFPFVLEKQCEPIKHWIMSYTSLAPLTLQCMISNTKCFKIVRVIGNRLRISVSSHISS